MASGVTQPAHSLVRGKAARSRTSTLRPASRSLQAQVDPAGPPPTMMASAVCMLVPVRCSRILVVARPRYVGVAVRREHDLEELQRTGLETGGRAGQVQAPHAHELFVVHVRHLVRRGFEVLEPRSTGACVVWPEIFDIEYGELVWLEHGHRV